jgi:hypothetical protein
MMMMMMMMIFHVTLEISTPPTAETLLHYSLVYFIKLVLFRNLTRSCGSSVQRLCYRLDDQGSIPGSDGISSLCYCVQTGYGTYTVS